MPLPTTAAVGTAVHFLGNLMTFRATAGSTGGTFTLMECVSAPGAGAPPHLHTDDEEAFYVMDPGFEFLLGEAVLHPAAGETLFVPRNTPHAFRNTGAVPARVLILNFPGGPHERFFLDVGSEAPMAGPPDVPALTAAAARHGIVMLAP